MARPLADRHGPKFLNLGVNINGRDNVPIVGTLNPAVLLVVIKRGIKSPFIPYHIFLYSLP